MPDLHNPAVLASLGLLFLISAVWGMVRLIRGRLAPPSDLPPAGGEHPRLPLSPVEALSSCLFLATLIVLASKTGPPMFLFGVLLLALYLLKRHHLNPLTFWGLHRCPCLPTIGLALNAWLTAWAPMTALAAASTLLLHFLGIPVKIQDALQYFLDAESPYAVASFLTLAIVIAPVTEEILFRGLLYPALRVHLGPQSAALLNGALFALMHLHAPSFLSLTLLGYLLARLVETTGRLPTAIFAHAFFNAGTCLLLLLERYA